jgi:hypothetical protein
MPRGIVAVAVAAASLALAWPVASGAGAPSGTRAAAQEPGHITLRLRYRGGPWKKALYVKLVKTRLISFSACAIRNWQPATEAFDCDLAGGDLSGRNALRLEQNPIGGALRRSDSPGWGMVGASETSRLGAVLSNSVTGDRFGIFHYRVTLRDASGRILATSNTVTINWHR